MSDDFSGVTATLNKPAGYNTGDTIVITIAGVDVETHTVTRTDTVTLTVTASDGAVGGPITVAVPMSAVAATNDSVKITAVSSSLGVAYSIAANGLTATATAP